MKRRIALVAAAVLLPLVPVTTPTAEAHADCGKQEPYCMDYRNLVQKPERQEIISRVMGHHCWDHLDEDQPGRDTRVIYSRVGVVFRDVTRDFGWLESVTVYLEGSEPQVMGGIFAQGKNTDFRRHDFERHKPPHTMPYPINKKIEFSHVKGRKDIGRYWIHHDSAATGPAPERPGPNPRDGGRYGDWVDCRASHDLIIDVVPPSAPPCRNKPPNPCPPQ